MDTQPSSPEFVRLKFFPLKPEKGLPNIPECLPGMQLARKKGHDLYIVAELDEDGEVGEVLGYFCLQERHDPDRWDWRISYLFIRPFQRRRGIAAEVLRVLKSELRVLTASVAEENLAAQLLLRQAGFRCTRIVRRGERDWYVFRFPVEPGEGKASE